MRIRSALLAASVALAATVAGVPALSVSAAPPKVAVAKYQLLLTFDHHESLRANSRVKDSSGHRHPGKVLVAAGGSLRSDRGMVRRAADFPNRCRSCGRAIIEIADGPGLDPQRRSFSFGAAVRVTHAQSVGGANVVQKGYFGQAGGQWKLQLKAGGFPSCVVYGSRGRIIVDSTRAVANGRWHRISCQRTPTAVLLSIDGAVRGRSEGITGQIANTSPVRIGGKKIDAGNKQFHGDIDTVFLRFRP